MKKMMLSALLLSILTPVSFASSKAENEIRITYGAIFNQAALIDYCRNYPIKEWLRVGFGFGANYMISWFQAEDFNGGIREDRLKPMKGDDKNLYYNSVAPLSLKRRPIAKDKITTMFSPASGYYPSFDVVWFGAFDKKIDRLGGSAGITLSYSF